MYVREILIGLAIIACSTQIRAQVPCPAPPGNAGAFACAVCDFATLSTTTDGQFPSNPGGDWCGGVIDNDQYFGFTAGPTGEVEFEVTVGNCSSGSGIQAALFDPDANVVGTCIYTSILPGELVTLAADSLTPGRVYLIGIDGFAGAICDFTITPVSGLATEGPTAAGPIYGPRQTCFGDSLLFEVDPVVSATGYFWQVRTGPFTAGTLVSPNATQNPFTGSSDPSVRLILPELPIYLGGNVCDTVELTVYPVNTCFPPDSASAATHQVLVCREAFDTVRRSVCFGDSLEYPAGSNDYYGLDDYFQYNYIPVGLGPPNNCEVFEVFILAAVFEAIDTLALARDTLLCDTDHAGAFTESISGGGLYYRNVDSLYQPSAACGGTLQPYNVYLASALASAIPDSVCVNAPIDIPLGTLPPTLNFSVDIMGPSGQSIDPRVLVDGIPEAGTYVITASDTSCFPPRLIYVADTLSVVVNATATQFNGALRGLYQSAEWTVNGAVASQTDSLTADLTGPDTVRIGLTAAGPCGSVMETWEYINGVSNASSIAGARGDFTLWPNPSRGALSWKFDLAAAGARPISLVIYDATGRVVQRRPLSPLQARMQDRMDLTALPRGSYRAVLFTTRQALTRSFSLH